MTIDIRAQRDLNKAQTWDDFISVVEKLFTDRNNDTENRADMLLEELIALASRNKSQTDFTAMVKFIAARNKKNGNAPMLPGIEKPLPDGIPVLMANPPSIKFITASEGDTGNIGRDTKKAFDFTASWASDLGITLDQLTVTETSEKGWGASCGLSVFLALACRILNIRLPSTIASTGCWSVDKSCRMTPVSEDTMADKVAIARLFGYSRIIVVNGQKGIPDDMAYFIDPSPEKAMLEIFPLLREESKDSFGALQMLYLFDKRVVRSAHPPDYRKVHELLTPFLSLESSSLVCAMANDICSRAALHSGCPEAEDHSVKCDTHLEKANKQGESASGFIGEYLTWQLHSHKAVVAIDTGRWNDQERVWKTIDKKIRELSRDSSLRTEILDARLCLQNTRARRKWFLGRLNEDPGILKDAWNDLIINRKDWKSVFDMHARNKDSNENVQRQHNQCLEVLFSYHDLTGSWPGWEDELTAPHFNKWWTEEAHLTWWTRNKTSHTEELSLFDLFTYLRWAFVHRPDDIDPQSLIDLVLKENSKTNPHWMCSCLFEQMIINRIHGFESILQLLEDNSKDGKRNDPESILSILNLRSMAVVELYKPQSFGLRDKVLVDPHRTKRKNKYLNILSDRLLEDIQNISPDNSALREKELLRLIHRCPY